MTDISLMVRTRAGNPGEGRIRKIHVHGTLYIHVLQFSYLFDYYEVWWAVNREINN